MRRPTLAILSISLVSTVALVSSQGRVPAPAFRPGDFVNSGF